jgi:hypothetical protein
VCARLCVCGVCVCVLCHHEVLDWIREEKHMYLKKKKRTSFDHSVDDTETATPTAETNRKKERKPV